MDSFTSPNVASGAPNARSALDKLISSMGLALAILLFVGGGLLVFGSTFVSQQVSDQVTSQRITMPSGAALDNLGNEEDKAALEPYAGETTSTGAQAKAFADHYILNHMNASSDGRTYEEVSGEFQKLSDAEKASPEGQEMAALRQSLFMGNSIRGMLLNALPSAPWRRLWPGLRSQPSLVAS